MNIRKQTGLEFFYQSSLLTGTHPITIDVEDSPVDEVLKLCLKGQGLGFSIRNGTVVLYKEGDPAKKNHPVPVDPVTGSIAFIDKF